MVIFEEGLDLPKGSFNLSSESVQGNAITRDHHRPGRGPSDA